MYLAYGIKFDKTECKKFDMRAMEGRDYSKICIRWMKFALVLLILSQKCIK